MRKITKRVAIIGTAAAIAVGGSLAAWAAYQGSSTQTTTASSLPVGNVVITAGNTSGFWPGSSQVVDVNVTNTVSYPIKVESFTGSSAALSSGCPAGAMSITGIDNSSPTQPWDTVQPNEVKAFKIKVTMAGSADNTCAGQNFSLPYTANFVSTPN